METKRVTDWINMVLGVWLVLSPWFLTRDAMQASWFILLLGLGVVIVSIWAMAQPEKPTPEWWNIILGAILFFVPWMLRYYNVGPLAWNSWIVGVAVLCWPSPDCPSGLGCIIGPGFS